jgi:Glycosyl transferase family 2
MRIRVAVPVKDEEVLLPFFLRHYASFCDSIVVWDNGSRDRTTELAAAHPLVELRRFQSDGYDALAVLATMEETKRESVGRFDWCLFPDFDEFVVSRSPGGERAALEAASSDVLVPDGYCLVKGPDEPPLSLSRDLLEQLRFGYRSPPYSKPIVMRPSAKAVLHVGKHSGRRIRTVGLTGRRTCSSCTAI